MRGVFALLASLHSYAELSPALDEARLAKRNFFELSVTSKNSIHQGSGEYLCLLRNEASKPLDAAIKLLEKNVEARDDGLSSR